MLLISAVLAPIESLGWWAGWFGEKEAPPTDGDQGANDEDKAEIPQADHYLVYLSGVGAITDDSIPEEEIKWLEALNQRIPGTALVTEVFPYSVNNAGLTNKRAFAWLWRSVERMRLKNPMAIAALLVNIRNVLQVAVSADPRYGPIYNYGDRACAQGAWLSLKEWHSGNAVGMERRRSNLAGNLHLLERDAPSANPYHLHRRRYGRRSGAG
jgi:hypothetical protein